MSDADLDDSIVKFVAVTGLDYADARNALRGVRDFVPYEEDEQ